MTSTFYAGEPEGPVVKTAVPGPQGKDLIARLDKSFDTRAVYFAPDYTKSFGNYIVDPDDNKLLDV
jgi:4-aminobutyrate aminotransferase / (S)-3-amino-2-methylpropionate transaminase